MVSFSVSFLDYLPIIDRGHEHKNLQYFFHDFKHDCILRFDNFRHILIKLNFLIAIALDDEVLAHESAHIADYSSAKLIIFILGLIYCAVCSFNSWTGYLS